MKLKIMIMALLLMSVGIGSAVNRLPATEFVGDVNMNGYDVIDAKMGQSIYYVTVGPYDWCDYVTDGCKDEYEINAATTANDIVRVVGDISLNGTIYLRGEKELYLDGNIGVSASFVGAGSPLDIVVISTGDNFILSGTGIIDLNQVAQRGIYLTHPGDIRGSLTIRNGSTGIICYRNDGSISISGVKIHDVALGINIGNCSNITITHCTIYNSTSHGILLAGTNIFVDSNIIYNITTAAGIGSSYLDKGIINANRIYNTYREGILLTNVYNTTVNGNLIDELGENSYDLGLTIDIGENNIVSANVVLNSQLSGIMITGSDSTTVIGNVVVGAARQDTRDCPYDAGIVISNGATGTIVIGNNIVDKSGKLTYGIRERDTCSYGMFDLNSVLSSSAVFAHSISGTGSYNGIGMLRSA